MKFIKKYPKNISKKSSNFYNRRFLRKSSSTRNCHSSKLTFGTLGIKIFENCKLKYSQLESIRKLFLPFSKDVSKVWFKGNFSTPLTKKAAGTRMGKGKGKLSHWVSPYKKGEVIIEFENTFNRLSFRRLFKILRYKLPFKYNIISKKC